MQDMIFRLATEQDKEAVFALYQAAKGKGFCVWDDSYPSWGEIHGDVAHESLYVLCDGERIIGALSVLPENEMDDLGVWHCQEGACEIGRITVDEAYRGRSLSLYMVTCIKQRLQEKGVRAIHLSAAKGNIPAHKTYAKADFAVVGEAELYGGAYLLLECLL